MVLALALGKSLLACGSLTEAGPMRRFQDWWHASACSCTGHCFDIGNTTRAALGRFASDANPVAGSTHSHSTGHGSPIRPAPVAIRFWRHPEARQDAATRQSRRTHGAAEALNACIALADMLAGAIAGASRAQLPCDGPGTWAGEAAAAMAGALAGGSALPAAWLGRLAWRDRLERVASDLFAASLANRVCRQAVAGRRWHRGAGRASAARLPCGDRTEPGFAPARPNRAGEVRPSARPPAQPAAAAPRCW